MTMKTFVRDSTVMIKVNFYDQCDNPTNPVPPNGATVTLNFMKNQVMQNLSYPMTQSGNDWTYVWDSRAADSGPVFGHAQTDGPVPISSIDFEFLLKANRANKVLAGPVPYPYWDDYADDRSGGRF